MLLPDQRGQRRDPGGRDASATQEPQAGHRLHVPAPPTQAARGVGGPLGLLEANASCSLRKSLVPLYGKFVAMVS